MEPLNQIYRQKKTFRDYPEIEKTYNEITKLSLEKNFYRDFGNGDHYPKGRRYDDAVLFHSNVDFNGKTVCELGARDGVYLAHG